jgi:hypothetical protein
MAPEISRAPSVSDGVDHGFRGAADARLSALMAVTPAPAASAARAQAHLPAVPNLPGLTRVGTTARGAAPLEPSDDAASRLAALLSRTTRPSPVETSRPWAPSGFRIIRGDRICCMLTASPSWRWRPTSSISSRSLQPRSSPLMELFALATVLATVLASQARDLFEITCEHRRALGPAHAGPCARYLGFPSVVVMLSSFEPRFEARCRYP